MACKLRSHAKIGRAASAGNRARAGGDFPKTGAFRYCVAPVTAGKKCLPHPCHDFARTRVRAHLAGICQRYRQRDD